ncbi:MCP four helix bundle domain-containing protein [Patescibacteria group bacterium]|nr:MCP four helix bundle domain-containing protein [Patescibacteria group bacterium]
MLPSLIKTIHKKRLLVGFFVAALFIFVVGSVGIWGVLNTSNSFERVESDITQEIVILEDIRSALFLTLLEMTTFLVLDFPTTEIAEKQISRIMEYGSHFEDNIAVYNQHINQFGRSTSALDLDQRTVISLVETIVEGKRTGLSIEEILPHKKQLKTLEEEKIFPVIQKSIDFAKEQLAIERTRTQFTVQITILFIILSGITSILLIIFLGFRIVKKERLTDQFREQLISIASHQLKAPLTVIRGHAELLLESNISGENKKTARIIRDTSESMNVLVRDLLDLSKIDQGKFVFEKKPTNICDLLIDIVDILEPLAQANEVTIQFTKPKEKIFVLTDESKMRQALQNVIGNGIKYNKQGGTLSIDFKKEDNQLVVVIKDEGIGIPKEERGMIFERFYRASNTRQKSQLGTGLGLFIARVIINQSGGEIKFKSEENKGTTFYITLSITEKRE